MFVVNKIWKQSIELIIIAMHNAQMIHFKLLNRKFSKLNVYKKPNLKHT